MRKVLRPEIGLASDSSTSSTRAARGPARTPGVAVALGTAFGVLAAGGCADIWGFGVLFMEMLTGRRAFEGETISDTLASVLKTDPDWDSLPEETPARIRTLLKRCLDRNPKRRQRRLRPRKLLRQPDKRRQRSGLTTTWIHCAQIAPFR